MNTTTVKRELITVDPDTNARKNITPESVQGLADSVKRHGILTPVIAQPNGDGKYHLIAGFRRMAAADIAGVDEIPVILRTDDAQAVQAIENMQREQLNPLEEARAIAAVIADGYTEEGAAEQLSLSPKMVAARMQILRLTPELQEFVGAGEIALGSVPVLAKACEVSEQLGNVIARAVARTVEEGTHVRLDAWGLGRTIEHDRQKGDEVYVSTAIPASVLGRKKPVKDLVDEINAAFKKQASEYYTPEWDRTVTATEQLIDEARAAGVLFELGNDDGFRSSLHVICSAELIAAHAEALLKEELDEVKARHRPTSRSSGGEKPGRKKRADMTDAEKAAADEAKAKRERERELIAQAHGVNLDLGLALIEALGDGKKVAPGINKDVAAHIVDGFLRSRSDYETTSGMRLGRMAASGLGLCLADWQGEREDKRGKKHIAYPGTLKDGVSMDTLEKKARKWILDGKTGEGMVGRLFVAIAMSHFSLKHVLTKSQNMNTYYSGIAGPDGYDHLVKLVKPHLPPTYKKLVKQMRAAGLVSSDAGRATGHTIPKGI